MSCTIHMPQSHNTAITSEVFTSKAFDITNKPAVTVSVDEVPTTPDATEVTLDEAFPSMAVSEPSTSPEMTTPATHEAFFGADALIKAGLAQLNQTEESHEAFFNAHALIKGGLERLMFSEASYPTRCS